MREVNIVVLLHMEGLVSDVNIVGAVDLLVQNENRAKLAFCYLLMLRRCRILKKKNLKDW